MTQTVRFKGRFINADEDTADIICRVASAMVVPSRRDIGAGGDTQVSISPSAIVLRQVEPTRMVVLRKGTWTHVLWSGVTGQSEYEMTVRDITIEGGDVRVLV